VWFGQLAGEAHVLRVSMALTPYIDRYLAEIRPALLRGHVSDAFWSSTYRAPLSEQSIHTKVCAATEEELGQRNDIWVSRR
jgi:hypothetical protein